MSDQHDSRIITETFDFDGGRQVSVLVPSARPEALVFAGDGPLIASWRANYVPPMMIVGVHATDADDEMARIREYSPAIDPEKFAGHEHFFVEVVGAWVKERFDVSLPPERTAICGVSAGGELSLALGIRHPDRYGNVFCMSPGGGYQPPEQLPDMLPRFYLTAGKREPWFLENAARWKTALELSGADVIMTERDGDHGDPFWAEEFPRMVDWAFGPR